MTGRLRWLAVAVAAALAIAGCSDTPAEGAGSLTVEIFGPYRDDEAELFAESLAAFSERTGIDIRYTGTGSFVSDLRAQALETANPPDIAIIPQPGLVAELFRAEKALPLDQEVVSTVDSLYPEPERELGEVDGVLVGVPFRTTAKSLVWYRPDVFAERGLTVPRTLAELLTLVRQVQAEGTAPWCFAIEAQGATGWAATDWAEDLVLRLAGPDVYDQWVAGEVGFSDPGIRRAHEHFRTLVLEAGRIHGGLAAGLGTNVRDVHEPLLTDPPGCLLYRQGSAAFGWMPDGVEFGPDGDVDAFVLPAIDEETTPPVVVGVDLAVGFTDRPEVAAVLTYLATPESTRAWEEAGGFVSPRLTTQANVQPSDRAALAALRAAPEIRIDASDAMPPAIGTTLLWEQLTAWVAGARPYDAFAATLDDARSRLPG